MKKTTFAFLGNCFLSLGCALALSGCETSDDRTLAASQACLDSATSATAQTCAAMVQSLTSPEAYMIRCSANFVAQGFTGTTVGDAITKIKNNTGGTNPTVVMMAYLNFKNASPSIDSTVSYCQSSGSKSMLRLATAAKLATTIISAVGGSIDITSPTAATQLQTYIQTLITTPNATTNAALGNTAVLANSAYCGAGSSYVGTEVCVNLQNALATSSDPATIGAALLAQFNTNSGH